MYFPQINIQSCIPHHILILLSQKFLILLWIFLALLHDLADLLFCQNLQSLFHLSKCPHLFMKHTLNVNSWVNYFFISLHHSHSIVYIFHSIGAYLVYFSTFPKTLYKMFIWTKLVISRHLETEVNNTYSTLFLCW